MKSYIVFLCFFLAPVVGAAAVDDDPEFRALKERVDTLQKTLSEMSLKTFDRKGSVQTFLAESVSLGGFLENSITSVWGEDTSSQTVADSHRLGINIAADLSSRVRVVTQYTTGFSYAFRNEHNNPSHGSALIPTTRRFEDVTFGSLLTQAFGEYDFSDNHRVQTGIGYVPFGRAYQVRDPVLFLKRRGPQMIRTSGVSQVVIADPFWKGVHFTGTFSDIEYHLYSTSPLDHSGKMGGGSRLAWHGSEFFQLGTSVQVASQADVSYTAYGADLFWARDVYGITMEWSRHDSDVGSPESYYIQPFVRFFDKTLTVFVDVDYLKNPLGQTTLGSAAVNDPYIKWEYTFGFNYFFLPNAKIRLDFIKHDYTGATAEIAGQNRDYYSTSLSSGFSF